MYTTVKILIIFFILAFISLNVLDIAKHFSDTRTITVIKEVPKTQMIELKGYEISNSEHFEQAGIKVHPANFSDYLLLTSENGNLVSILFKIAASLCLAWFVFKLKPDNLFSKRSYIIATCALGFFLLSILMMRIGLDHTIAFWDTLYWKVKGNPVVRNGFSVLDDFNLLPNVVLIWMVSFIYKYFGSYYSNLKESVPGIREA